MDQCQSSMDHGMDQCSFCGMSLIGTGLSLGNDIRKVRPPGGRGNYIGRIEEGVPFPPLSHGTDYGRTLDNGPIYHSLDENNRTHPFYNDPSRLHYR